MPNDADEPAVRPFREPASSRATMAAMTCRCFSDFSLPISDLGSAVLAVNSLPGRAKLGRCSEPLMKSPSSTRTAAGSLYGLLVIWQSTQSLGASGGKHNRRTQFGGGEVRKGESDKHYVLDCR
jgi:hypothetical protein